MAGGAALAILVNAAATVGSGGSALLVQWPVYAATFAITAICITVIADDYKINPNDNHYNLEWMKYLSLNFY